MTIHFIILKLRKKKLKAFQISILNLVFELIYICFIFAKFSSAHCNPYLMNEAKTCTFFFFTDYSQDSFFPVLWYCANGCGQKYKNKSSYYRHMKFECGVPKKFNCSSCAKKFARKSTLKIHMVTQHKIFIDWVLSCCLLFLMYLCNYVTCLLIFQILIRISKCLLIKK